MNREALNLPIVIGTNKKAIIMIKKIIILLTILFNINCFAQETIKLKNHEIIIGSDWQLKENGKLLPYKFKMIIPINSDTLIVMKDNKVGVIDKDGKFIHEPMFEGIYYDRFNGQLLFLKNRKWTSDKNKSENFTNPEIINGFLDYMDGIVKIGSNYSMSLSIPSMGLDDKEPLNYRSAYIYLPSKKSFIQKKYDHTILYGKYTIGFTFGNDTVKNEDRFDVYDAKMKLILKDQPRTQDFHHQLVSLLKNDLKKKYPNINSIYRLDSIMNKPDYSKLYFEFHPVIFNITVNGNLQYGSYLPFKDSIIMKPEYDFIKVMKGIQLSPFLLAANKKELHAYFYESAHTEISFVDDDEISLSKCNSSYTDYFRINEFYLSKSEVLQKDSISPYDFTERISIKRNEGGENRFAYLFIQNCVPIYETKRNKYQNINYEPDYENLDRRTNYEDAIYLKLAVDTILQNSYFWDSKGNQKLISGIPESEQRFFDIYNISGIQVYQKYSGIKRDFELYFKNEETILKDDSTLNNLNQFFAERTQLINYEDYQILPELIGEWQNINDDGAFEELTIRFIHSTSSKLWNSGYKLSLKSELQRFEGIDEFTEERDYSLGIINSCNYDGNISTHPELNAVSENFLLTYKNKIPENSKVIKAILDVYGFKNEIFFIYPGNGVVYVYQEGYKPSIFKRIK